MTTRERRGGADGDLLRVTALNRELDLDDFRMERGDGKQTTLRFSASSEYPVERYFGTEVLEHSTEAVRLERVKRGAVPLLFNHDTDDVIGMVDDMRIEGRRLMCDAHLFDTARAREVEAMLDGGLRNVSIRYRIHTVQVDKNGDERVIDWEPMEQSIVTIPADPTVGMGRAGDGDTAFEVKRIAEPQQSAVAAINETRSAEMPDTKDVKADDKEAAADDKKETTREAPVEQRFEVKDRPRDPSKPVDSEQARKMEEERILGIDNLCKVNQINDENQRNYWVNAGLSLYQVGKDILDIHERRAKTNPNPLGAIGMGQREVKRFSMLRALKAVVDNDWKLAPFELECSRAVAEKTNREQDPKKFYVPFEVMNDARVSPTSQRDLTVASAGAGGYLVETANMGFIELLRNRSVAFRMGARRLSGLVGNVAVPRQSAAATAYWLSSESTQITESAQTFVQMALTPKTVGAYTEISRKLLLQSSPDAEGIVIGDLAAVTALAADAAVLNGGGSEEPTGILGTSGVGSVSGSSLAYAGVLEFQTDVAAANVMPMQGGYVSTPAVASLLMQRSRFSNTDTPLWDGNIWNGTMAGFPAMSSNQMPSATALFGDWQEVVVGEWGVLEVEVNPYANFQAGIIGVRAMYSMDVGVRRPFAFSAASSIS